MVLVILMLIPLLSGYAQDIPSRIVGGHEAFIEDYPFMVSVQIYKQHYCGGSIIKPDYVLTAAHCIEQGVRYRIKAGTDDLLRRGIIRNVKEIQIHPNYKRTDYSYDIALMKLEKPLEYIPGKIESIKLPEYSTSVPLSWGATVGWGFTYNVEEDENKLRAEYFKVFSEEVCPLEMEFCAGNGMKGACNGDSGGPFVINNTIYGVVAYGPEICGSAPTVYTKVPILVDWIKASAQITDEWKNGKYY